MASAPEIGTDPAGLAALRGAAKADPKSTETLRKVANQFEALFTQMLLKSMRDASFGNELFESDENNLYRDMYDQQIAALLAKQKGLGIADMLVRQLGGQPAETAIAATPPVVPRPAMPQANAQAPFANPESFVRELTPHAEVAARTLGARPEALLSIAALETGWGRAVMRAPDGRSSHNLFGIKADSRWSGPTVAADTLEYQDGVAVRRRELFRAYGSYAESFTDFAAFVRANPRYQPALARANEPLAFVTELARAGYATDPDYARKVGRVLAGEPLQAALKSGADRPLTG
jgi:flagellar protein FlgJ